MRRVKVWAARARRWSIEQQPTTNNSINIKNYYLTKKWNKKGEHGLYFSIPHWIIIIGCCGLMDKNEVIHFRMYRHGMAGHRHTWHICRPSVIHSFIVAVAIPKLWQTHRYPRRVSLRVVCAINVISRRAHHIYKHTHTQHKYSDDPMERSASQLNIYIRRTPKNWVSLDWKTEYKSEEPQQRQQQIEWLLSLVHAKSFDRTGEYSNNSILRMSIKSLKLVFGRSIHNNNKNEEQYETIYNKQRHFFLLTSDERWGCNAFWDVPNAAKTQK